MPIRIERDHIAIVLVRPRFSENVGAAARAMHNMGFRRLIIVDPHNYHPERALTLATHEAADIVTGAAMAPSLTIALADFHYVVGTSARVGRQRQVISSPSALAEHLTAISANNHVALVFGPEDRGLTNRDLRQCHKILNIPTADFSSINLAHSVMLVCYELHKAAISPTTPQPPRLASRHELDGMYEDLKKLLVRIDYIKPENPDYWINKIRRFSTRMGIRAREVSIIRGICRQCDWYARKCFRDGQESILKNDDR
ncbi:MAG: RNA methyltransferase [Deltaproteobacteria bacterium]|nr:MAG: RNA methyltransferase [Deltaproteobacteria bacterium]